VDFPIWVTVESSALWNPTYDMGPTRSRRGAKRAEQLLIVLGRLGVGGTITTGRQCRASGMRGSDGSPVQTPHYQSGKGTGTKQRCYDGLKNPLLGFVDFVMDLDAWRCDNNLSNLPARAVWACAP
jgi:hypothetical protein